MYTLAKLVYTGNLHGSPWIPWESHRNGKYDWNTTVGMWKSMEMAWREWMGMKTLHFLFPILSKPISLYVCNWQKNRYWRKNTQIRHLYLTLIFSCFWYRKTSIRREFTGYLFNDVHETAIGATAAGRNRNSQWNWEANGNKTSLNLGVGKGMGMNS